MEPNTPVLVGVGQVTHRSDAVADPIDLAAQAAELAFEDAGRDVAALVDVIAVPGILLMRRDQPAHRIADRLGLRDGRRISCPIGGNTPQFLVGAMGGEIAKGTIGAALIVGAEAGRSASLAAKNGAWPEVPAVDGIDDSIGDARPGLNDLETNVGLAWPPQVYALFESAIAARAGRTLDEQRVWLGEFMAAFTRVAAGHPAHAWFPTERRPEELSTISASNRMINEPYPKLLNSILAVDQAAAFVLTSVEAAERAGISRDRWVFSWGNADCNDVYFPSNRPDVSRAVGLKSAIDALLAAAGIGIDDMAFFDFYSCFPSAVQAAVEAAGLAFDDSRGFTVTGGLPYFGGPGNNYVSHAIVNMAARCRDERDGIGMVTGLGWYLTKHSVGLWSSMPPEAGWQRPDMSRAQREIDATSIAVVAPAEASGRATVEAFTVAHERDDGPVAVPVFARMDDGRRVLARSEDPAVARRVSGAMLVGESIAVRPGELTAAFDLL